VAHNVAIEAIIPEGLEHARGQKLLMEVGSVGPGESRTVRLALAAVSGGEHAVVIHAKAEGDLHQETTNYITVVAPSLKVGIDGPGLRYVGRNAVYALNVANDGRADSNNVRVLHKVPEGFKFVQADKGMTKPTAPSLSVASRAGERTELKVELAATQIGSCMLSGAVSETPQESELETHVDGRRRCSRNCRSRRSGRSGVEPHMKFASATTVPFRPRTWVSPANCPAAWNCSGPKARPIIVRRTG
jgi:uncharacterized repeat protein (TIGR01451 family)